jgi:hypothetical protein
MRGGGASDNALTFEINEPSQEHLKTAAAEREAALLNALAERQALKSAADAQQAQQAEFLRAERAEKEALMQVRPAQNSWYIMPHWGRLENA